MPSDLYFQVDGLVLVLSVALAFAASYRSLLARRILGRPVYRSHALWTTLVGLVTGVLVAPTAYYEFTGVVLVGLPPVTSVSYSSTPLLAVTYFVTIGVPLVVLWTWMDRSIEVALDMDFLHRDTIFWKAGARFVAWAIILAEAVLGVFVSGTSLVSIVYYVGFAGLVGYAAVVLFLNAKRVQDTTMKNYVRWVGVMAVSLVIVTFTWPYLSPFVLFAYALYRASGSFTKTTPLEVPSSQK
jgi:hypothetical protein